MENFLTEFDNHSEYANYADTTMLRPNVSWCVLEDEVHYTPVGLRMYYDTFTSNIGGIGEEAKKVDKTNGAKANGAKANDSYMLYIPDGEVKKFETNKGGSTVIIEPVGIIVPGKYDEDITFEKVYSGGNYPDFLVGFWVATILSGPIDPSKDNIYVVLQRILPRGAKSEKGAFPVKAVVKYRKIVDIQDIPPDVK